MGLSKRREQRVGHFRGFRQQILPLEDLFWDLPAPSDGDLTESRQGHCQRWWRRHSVNVSGVELSLPGGIQGTFRRPICCPLRLALWLPCAHRQRNGEMESGCLTHSWQGVGAGVLGCSHLKHSGSSCGAGLGWGPQEEPPLYRPQEGARDQRRARWSGQVQVPIS